MESEEIVVQKGLRFTRIWQMANKFTFQIEPIRKLLLSYVKDGKGWIDPFSGESSMAEITNDINPERKAKYHLHATDFINQLNGTLYNGILFDPPYSLRQVKECYDSIGIEMSFEESQLFPTNIKDLAAPKIKPNGIAICCGWDSTGFGRGRGFKLIELLLICHGGRHNDTIVTVERKINHSLAEYTD